MLVIRGWVSRDLFTERRKRKKMANQVVRVRRETIAACMTCPLCNKLLRDATTVSECLHTCEFLQNLLFSGLIFILLWLLSWQIREIFRAFDVSACYFLFVCDLGCGCIAFFLDGFVASFPVF